MSTRGLSGFRYNGKDVLIYNHSDSYPSGLGVETLETLRTLLKSPRLVWIQKMVEALKIIDEADPNKPEPTEEDIKNLADYTNLGVGSQSTSDWYCLTRGCQGDLQKCLTAGYALTNNNFIHDSLFCEHAYIINLDTQEFEVYEGFQQGKKGNGRYEFDSSNIPDHRSEKPIEEQYFPCSLVHTFPFNDLPSEKKFLAIMSKDDEEEEWLDEQFTNYFTNSNANKLLGTLSGILPDNIMFQLAGEISTAFCAGYNLERFEDA